MYRTFTLFHTDGCEYQTVKPLADELAARGHKVRLTDNMKERADVGIYCQHAVRPNANFSVIMLHDLAQRHDIWPDFWSHEPWNAFDIGFVPGTAWASRWLSQRKKAQATPRLGVFQTGWPKSDLIFKNKDEFHEKSTQLRSSLNLKHPYTILYAPSWENHGKQDDFVEQLKDLPVNLLLKQAPWSNAFPQVLANIEKMNALHRDKFDNVHIIDPNISIMYCIGISDLLVSDESSVLIEAALYEVPSLAVVDWLIPDRNPPRKACVPFDNVQKISRTELRNSVEIFLQDEQQGKTQALKLRNTHFSELGHSSQLAADIILASLAEAPPPIAPLGKDLDRRLQADLAQYQLAEQLAQIGKQDDAIKILLHLSSQKTDCWQVYNDLGVFSYQNNDVETAISLLEVATEKPDATEIPWKNLASLQLEANDRASAISSYGKILRKIPEDEDAINALGHLLFAEKGLPLTLWQTLLSDIRQQ